MGLQLLSLIVAKVKREDLAAFVKKVITIKDQDIIQRLEYMLSLLKLMECWDLAIATQEKIVRLLSGDTESESVSISIDDDAIAVETGMTTGLADLYLRVGQYHEAEAIYKKFLEGFLDFNGAIDSETVELLLKLSRAQQGQGLHEEVRSL